MYGGTKKLRIIANKRKKIENLNSSLDNYVTKKLLTSETLIN
jgi:hypothetical protein